MGFHPNGKGVARVAHQYFVRDHAGAVPTLDDACFRAYEVAFSQEWQSNQFKFWLAVYFYLNRIRCGHFAP